MFYTAARTTVLSLVVVLLGAALGFAAPGHAAVLTPERGPADALSGTFGATARGKPKPLPANTKRVSPYTLAEAGTVTHLVAYLDGKGRGKGKQQRLRLVVYGDHKGRPKALLGMTEEYQVRKGAAGRWISLALTKPVDLELGRYHLGIHSGASARVARYGVVERSTARRQNRNTFGAGPTRLFGRVQTSSAGIAIKGQNKDKKAPTVPQGLMVSGVAASSLALAWNPSTDNVGVAGYRVYRNGDRVATTSALTHLLGDLACGATHTLGVEAFDAAGNISPRASLSATTAACEPSPAPTPDTQPPSVPQGLTMTVATESAITLAWNPSTDNVGVAGYRMYRNGTAVATTTLTTYMYSGLACGTSYTLALEALDAAGNVSNKGEATTTRSTVACAPTPDTQPPSVPQGFTMTAATESAITLAWNPSTDDVGVAGYRMYRNGTAVGTTTLTTYTYTSLACGTSYTLALEAYDTAGNVSNKGEATTIRSTASCAPEPAPPTPPPPPSSPTAANLWVDTSGGTCTRAASVAAYDDARACPSLDAANDVCRDGDVVLVKGGTYTAQTISGSNARIWDCTLTVASGESATLTGSFVLSAAGRLDVGGFTVHGAVNFAWNAVSTNVVVRDVTAHRFLIQGATNVTIKGGTYGDFNGVDDPGTSDNYQNSKIEEYYTSRPNGVTIDGTTLHDFYCLPADCHAECLFIYRVSNVTVKNSRFYNCDFYNIFFAGGNDDNFVIENNSFGQPYVPNSNGTTRSPSYGRATGIEWKRGGAYSNHRVQFNSFHPGTGLSFDGNSGAFATIVGNVMRRNMCGTSATYRSNVMDATCHSTDVAAASFGYTNLHPGPAFDARLVPGARPIDAVPTNVLNGCPATDRFGGARPRGLGCDAGMHEAD